MGVNVRRKTSWKWLAALAISAFLLILAAHFHSSSLKAWEDAGPITLDRFVDGQGAKAKFAISLQRKRNATGTVCLLVFLYALWTRLHFGDSKGIGIVSDTLPSGPECNNLHNPSTIRPQ